MGRRAGEFTDRTGGGRVRDQVARGRRHGTVEPVDSRPQQAFDPRGGLLRPCGQARGGRRRGKTGVRYLPYSGEADLAQGTQFGDELVVRGKFRRICGAVYQTHASTIGPRSRGWGGFRVIGHGAGENGPGSDVVDSLSTFSIIFSHPIMRVDFL
ncbi:hypothetical protein GCM10010306_052120 [Streptomyces umbrinus]|nr:hypothetical protein GCM10010306_052120 [Streptomyces umbrinus]